MTDMCFGSMYATGTWPGGGREFLIREARPHMKSRMAPMRATAAAPMTMPAMAPPERPDLPPLLLEAAEMAEVVAAGGAEEVDVAVVVVGAELDEVVVKGLVSSDGHGSPGWSMNVEFFANWVCSNTDSDAFGLITPTMP
jgi:hypothetical protein